MLRTTSLTLNTLCFIIRQANLVKEFPAVFGEGDQALKLSVFMRSKIMEGLRQIKRQLYEKQSREFKDDDLLYYGDKSLWKKIESTEKEIEAGADPIRYEPLDKKKTVDVEWSPAMEQGICGLILLWMRPDSPGIKMFTGPMQPPITVVGPLSVGQMDDFVWPLIEQLKLKDWVDKFIGLGATDALEIVHDDEKKPEEVKK